MRVSLTDTEIDIARLIAGLRIRRSRQAGATNTPYRSGLSQEDIDLNSFGAELAFCKLYNLYPDLTTMIKSHTPDCISWSGKKIDVKQTDLEHGRLIVRATKRVEDADVYVLMRGVLPDYTFVGWCLSEEIIREDRLEDLGSYKVPTHVLPNEELRPPWNNGIEMVKTLIGEG